MARNNTNVKYAEVELVNIDGREYIRIAGLGQLFPMRKSKYAVNYSPVYISDNMSGKMENIPSISTSVLKNTFCQARRNVPGSICEKCFACNVLSRYSDCEKNVARNYDLLTAAVLPLELLPRFGNVRIARIESFGDVATVEQAINYCNIAFVNPRVNFGWWSKNVSIIEKAFDIVGKPENVVFIQSSAFVNKPEEKKSHYVDKVFTVFDDEYIAGVPSVREQLDKLAPMSKKDLKEAKTRIFEACYINCGARNCVACGKCYDVNDTTENVRERLK